MGAAGSVDASAVPGARKLHYFVAMKAFNLRQSEAKSLADQFLFLQRTDNSEADRDGGYMDCDALCAYLQIPAPRQATLRAIFNLSEENHRVPYAAFMHFLEQATALAPPVSSTTEAREEPAAMTTRPQKQQQAKLTSCAVGSSPSNQEEDHDKQQLACIPVVRPVVVNAGGAVALTPGLWKKREITIQERIVEYTKIDDQGVAQHLVEKEKHQHEIIHMEATSGEFAHREVTHFEQSEQLNHELVHHDTGKEEFVHLKSKDDEISHFESTMPQSRQAECDQPPPSPTLKRETSESPLEPEENIYQEA